MAVAGSLAVMNQFYLVQCLSQMPAKANNNFLGLAVMGRFGIGSKDPLASAEG